jgi:hypothetical protein
VRQGHPTYLEALQTSDGRTEVKAVDIVELAVDAKGEDAVETIIGWHLVLHIETDQLRSPSEMEAVQARIAAACAEKHPRLAEYFYGLSVSMLDTEPPDKGQGYRSVYSFEELIGGSEDEQGPSTAGVEHP